MAIGRAGGPQNMVAGFVNNVAAIMLVDTGASVSILNADFYRRLLKNGSKLEHLNEYVRLTHLKCADGTPMPIVATVAAPLQKFTMILSMV